MSVQNGLKLKALCIGDVEPTELKLRTTETQASLECWGEHLLL